jgi:hypothetical protein
LRRRRRRRVDQTPAEKEDGRDPSECYPRSFIRISRSTCFLSHVISIVIIIPLMS